jgi:chromosome segregation and condensation protein ScpB
MDGLLAKGLMRKEKGELYAPLKYVVALPPLVEQLSAEPVEQQPPLCPMKPSSPIEGTLKEILRALLFLGGSRHLSAVRLAEMTGHSVGNVEMVVRELTLEMGKTSLRIDLTSSGYVMGTRPEFQDYTQKVLTKRQQPRRPSESELSVIAAIIAHGGPASRDEIADLRDKMPSGSLNSLLHSGLVGVTQSRKDGLPVYYLTPKLLDKYGFKSFEDLESFMKEHKAKSPIQETEIS